MLAIVCPGQGSQTPGFLAPWLELPGFRDRLAWLSAAADVDLVEHGTVSDADTIKDTAVAQPLIVGAGLVSMLSLFAHPADGFRIVGAGAGHSVGEITAAASAGVLTAEQAMVLVRERGKGMAAASAVRPTGMAAVVGGAEEDVLAKIEAHGLTPANRNGANQIVAAGTKEQLEALAADAPAKARVIPLATAGAFHTEHMAPAVETLAGYARAISVHDPRVPLISNKDGQVVHSGAEVLRRLVSQVSNPVRWDLTMETLAEMGVTGMIEVPPAGTLTGLAKRGLKGVETLALKTPDDLPKAHQMLAEHGEAHHALDPAWRLVISPAKGTITIGDLVPGDVVEAGSVVGSIKTLREQTPATAVHGGQVVEWLVADGDPVAPGQPLLRLYPEES